MGRLDKIMLSSWQRQRLLELTTKGEHKAQLIRNAQIILKSAQHWTDEQIAVAFNLSKRTVIRIRQGFVGVGDDEQALLAALGQRPRPGAPLHFGPQAQALVIAQACTPAPEGYQRWTLALLSERISLESEVGSISRETVRRILKKTNLSLTAISNGASPK